MNYRPLSESLPAPLPNGQQIRSFAKHCPNCHLRVEASHMRGLARNVNGQVFLAARAECPQCGHQFNISCVIAADKSVSRLWVPTWFMLWWLSGLEMDTPPPADEGETLDGDPEPLPPPAPVTVSSETLGSYDGRPIPAWVDWQGRRYRYHGVDKGQVLGEDCLRHDGLVFRRLEDIA